jgi:hypothetical protein
MAGDAFTSLSNLCAVNEVLHARHRQLELADLERTLEWRSSRGDRFAARLRFSSASRGSGFAIRQLRNATTKPVK